MVEVPIPWNQHPVHIPKNWQASLLTIQTSAILFEESPTMAFGKSEMNYRWKWISVKSVYRYHLTVCSIYIGGNSCFRRSGNTWRSASRSSATSPLAFRRAAWPPSPDSTSWSSKHTSTASRNRINWSGPVYTGSGFLISTKLFCFCPVFSFCQKKRISPFEPIFRFI